jgi:hypothetical protein
MIAGIFALIQALPELFKLLNRLGDVVDRFMKWSDKNKFNEWIDNLEASIVKLDKAKTPEEKLDAAQSLVDSIRKLK